MSLFEAPERRIVGHRAMRLSGRRRRYCEANSWRCCEEDDDWATGTRADDMLVTASEADKLAVQQLRVHNLTVPQVINSIDSGKESDG